LLVGFIGWKDVMEGQNRTQIILEQAREGDREAFDRLVERVRGPLEALIRSRIEKSGQKSLDAAEVLQETLVRAFQCLGRFTWRGEGSFQAWLGGIARHVILKALRPGQFARTLEIPQDVPAPDLTASKILRRKERYTRFQEALNGLSPSHREVIHLARFEGLALEEVAARMGRSKDAVKQLLSRAIRELRQTFGKTGSFHFHEPSPSPEGGGNG
jgi:RNA polymerase sigma-70 factor, ECF subfamily